MILAIDVGNTQIVAGCAEGEDILHTARFETCRGRTEYEYAVLLKQSLEFSGLDCGLIEGGIVASVVPSLTAVMRRAVELLCGRRALVVGSGLKTGMNILIDDPAQLGSDMVASGVAAMERYTLPVVIVDMGTAATFSVVDRSANYLGGAIFPGVTLSRTALTAAAAQLPDVPVTPPKSVVATNTISCMQSGLTYGFASMIDGMVERIEAQLGSPVTVVATGDEAKIVAPLCKRDITVDDRLFLRGRVMIYKKNRKAPKSDPRRP